MFRNHHPRRLRKPLLGTKILEPARPEHLEHLHRFGADVLDVVRVVLGHDAHIASHVVESARCAVRREDGDAGVATEEKRPFVCVGVPVHLPQSTGVDEYMCGGGRDRHGEVGAVRYADFAAGKFLGGLRQHAVREAVFGCGAYSFAVGGQRAREGAAEDVFFVLGEGGEDGFGDAEVFGEDGDGRAREVVG